MLPQPGFFVTDTFCVTDGRTEELGILVVGFHLKKWASKGRGYLPDDDDDDAIFTTLTFCDPFRD